MKNQARTSKPTLVPQIGGPLQPGTTGPVDTETLPLLEAWAREDATDDPEKLRAAKRNSMSSRGP